MMMISISELRPNMLILVSVSCMLKGLASYLKYCYIASVKRNRHVSAQELSVKDYNVLDHVCGDHDKCEEILHYDKEAKRLSITYNPPEDHCINKEQDPHFFKRLKNI